MLRHPKGHANIRGHSSPRVFVKNLFWSAWRNRRGRCWWFQSAQQRFPESSGFCSLSVPISPHHYRLCSTRAELVGPRPGLFPSQDAENLAGRLHSAAQKTSAFHFDPSDHVWWEPAACSRRSCAVSAFLDLLQWRNVERKRQMYSAHPWSKISFWHNECSLLSLHSKLQGEENQPSEKLQVSWEQSPQTLSFLHYGALLCFVVVVWTPVIWESVSGSVRFKRSSLVKKTKNKKQKTKNPAGVND